MPAPLAPPAQLLAPVEQLARVRLVQLCFDFYMIEAKENLIGDRAYDSDPLDEELRKDGIDEYLASGSRGNAGDRHREGLVPLGIDRIDVFEKRTPAGTNRLTCV